MVLRDGSEALENPEQRWRFVKRNRDSVPVLLTHYDAAGKAAQDCLLGLRKIDFLGIKECGYSWDMVTPEEAESLQVVSESKEQKVWDSPAMRGEPLPVAGRPSDETYLRRMRERGVDEDEARKLREFIDSL